MKKLVFIIILLFCLGVNAQTLSNNLHRKQFVVKNNTVKIDSVSISAANFKVFDNSNSEIDSKYFEIDFGRALLKFTNNSFDGKVVIIQYTSFPNFLTKSYYKFDKKLIVPNTSNTESLYSLTTNISKTQTQLFNGLDALGNITRGITVGNNQNAVVNSTLDLQLAGKLSDKVTLKASIVDTNLPIQENGNTYELNEFDRVFIELFSDTWSINAGDIYLNNAETRYLNFNKKVSGLEVKTSIKNDKSKWDFQTSGAIVKGKYNKVEFSGIEGNQGPYQLSNFNNKYVLILSGTEEVYVNGQLLKRGENNDYTIDYNTAELVFNTTFPVTSDMRIQVEYQFNDRVYTRFTTYNKVAFESEKLKISGYFFNENDLKNQPLEQDLSIEQKQLLANAGNDSNAMVTSSAFQTDYSENQILYKKTQLGIEEIFEYSTNETDELYSVSFSYVGENQGNYILKDVIALGKIFEYAGQNSGNYNPVKQLIAPEKLQLAVFKGSYNPSNKTSFNFETAFSENDKNLFSSIDDENNDGLAARFGLIQVLIDKKWKLINTTRFESINKYFSSVERIQNIEFNRDWNLISPSGNQQLFSTSLNFSNEENKEFNYTFEDLQFGSQFKGNRHLLNGNITSKKMNLSFNGSLLNNESNIEKGTFAKYNASSIYNLNKKWLGLKLSSEINEQKEIISQELTPFSHKFNEFEAFLGIGDSTNVFTKFGVVLRKTDSVQNDEFTKVNYSRTYYLNSKLINSESIKLSAYMHYRTVDNKNINNEKSLNSRIVYQQQLFNQFLSFNTRYETLSGNIPQQDYTYLKTEPGQGFYTWIDYNNNSIKELNEFEIAQFQDEAEYLRIILPTVNYLPTHQNKLTQTLILNPQQWYSKTGVKKIFSKFYNQTYILVDNKQIRNSENFNLNPFDISSENLIGLNYNFNNSLIYNRTKKHFKTSFNYLKSKNKNTSSIDNIESELESYQLKFEHFFTDFWKLDLTGNSSNSFTNSENYNNRNYELKNEAVLPKISFYYNDNSFFSLFYEFEKKENQIGDLETLKLQKIGVEANFTNSTKNSIKADFNYISNSFTGNNNSPVGYQMLEGLQPGKNFTWTMVFLKKINSFLHFNLNYLGRKSETSKTIHTGSVQLKAIF